MTDELDPELVQHALDELEAVRTGHRPIHEELGRSLGELSISTSRMDQAQEEVEKSHAALEFIKDFSKLLPRANTDGVIELDGTGRQYIARQVNANTIFWRVGPPNKPYLQHQWPFYIAGRARQESNTTLLLLLPAASSSDSANREREHQEPAPLFAEVRTDDMERWDALAARIQAKELSDEEIGRMTSQRTGRLEVSSRSPGSIRLSYPGDLDFIRARVSDRKVEDKGVRLAGALNTREPQRVKYGVPLSIMDALHVNTKLARLAESFNVSNQYEDLLQKRRARQAQAGVQEIQESEVNQSTIEQIAYQNERLKNDLKRAMLGTGLFTEEEIDRAIAERYPKIDA